MSIPTTVRSQGGPFDVVYQVGNSKMGFVTADPSQRQNIVNVAPSIRVGGSAEYASSTFDQIVLPSFDSGGDMKRLQSGENRYQWSDGRVALWMSDAITLNSAWQVADAGVTATARQIVDFSTALGDYICVGAGTKLRVYDDSAGTWQDKGSFGASAIYLFSNDQYLFVACGGTDAFWRWDGTPSAGWTQPAASTYANGFGWFGDTLYRFYGSQIIPATNNNGSAWGSAISVGYPTTDVLDIIESQGYLYIAKPEGLYAYDGNEVYLVLDAASTRSTLNFRGLGSWRGVLYAPWITELYKCVARTVRDVTAQGIAPSMKGDEAKERYGHGRPIRVVPGPKFIYVAFDDGEGVYPEVLAYNDIGWHQIYRGTSGATMYAIGYSRITDQLLINDGSTRYLPIASSGEAPYPSYAASGSFTTPEIDAGYPDEMKAWSSITIETENCDANNTVTVEYSADGGPWTTVGTISENARTTLMLGGLSVQISAKKIAFRITLTRDPDDVTATPRIVLPIVVRTLVTTSPVYAYADVVMVDENAALENGFGRVGDVYTYQEMQDFISIMASTSETIVRLDEQGRYSRVKLMDHGEQYDRTADPALRVVQASFRFQEMLSGWQRQVEDWLRVSASAALTMFTWNNSSAYGVRKYGFYSYGA